MPPSASSADGRRARAAGTSRETIITAIRRWHALFGEPPCTADWNPSIARWRAQEWRIERYVAGDPADGAPWPSLNVVKRRFDGSFDAAVRAAGFEPRRPGPRRRPAGSARPDVAPRVPQAPVGADTATAELADRLAAAEARAAAAEAEATAAARQAAAERVRAERAEARATQAGQRARRAADRARRAVEARDRARARSVVAAATTREACEDRLATARAACDQRVAAMEARVHAAERRADAAEASARRVAALRTDAAPAGPAVLGAALTRLAAARSAGGAGDLRGALREVSAAAARWADRL